MIHFDCTFTPRLSIPCLPAPRIRGNHGYRQHTPPPAIIYLPARTRQLVQMGITKATQGIYGPGGAAMITSSGIVYLSEVREVA